MIDTVKQLAKEFNKIVKEFPEILYLGHPILRTKTEEIDINKGNKIGKKLGKTLIKYREITGIGRGLAAPQIGISKKVFVTYLNNKIQIYINPKIIWQSKKINYYRELCLSSGITWADIERPESITMIWVDKNGNKQRKTFNGFLARLIQHEYDHLDGIVNLDKAILGTISLVTDDPLKEVLREKPLI